jgi:hypothetical protein
MSSLGPLHWPWLSSELHGNMKVTTMNAQQLAEKFNRKTDAAKLEQVRQDHLAVENAEKRIRDIGYCQLAMEREVLPFLAELKSCLKDNQFSYAMQIDIDHKPIGVSFRIGDGGPTTISAAFGNIVVTHVGDSGTLHGVPYVYPPDAEPYISNSGDLTREKIAKLIEMMIDAT